MFRIIFIGLVLVYIWKSNMQVGEPDESKLAQDLQQMLLLKDIEGEDARFLGTYPAWRNKMARMYSVFFQEYYHTLRFLQSMDKKNIPVNVFHMYFMQGIIDNLGKELQQIPKKEKENIDRFYRLFKKYFPGKNPDKKPQIYSRGMV